MQDIVRHGPPCKLDQAPAGTKCKVDLGDGTFDIYVQSQSEEDCNPKWVHFGNFTEASYDFCMIGDNPKELD